MVSLNIGLNQMSSFLRMSTNGEIEYETSESSFCHTDNYFTQRMRFTSLLDVVHKVSFKAGDQIIQLGIGREDPNSKMSRHWFPQLVELLSVMQKEVRLISVDNNLEVLNFFPNPNGFVHREGQFFQISTPLYYPKIDDSGHPLLQSFLEKFPDTDNFKFKEKEINPSSIGLDCLICSCNFENFPFESYQNTKCIVATRSLLYVFEKINFEHSGTRAERLCLDFLIKICSSLAVNGVFVTTVADFDAFPKCSQLSIGLQSHYKLDNDGHRYLYTINYNLPKMALYLNDKLGCAFCVETIADYNEQSNSLLIIKKESAISII